MLKQVGRVKLSFFILVFFSIVGFGTLLVSRFHATAIHPPVNSMSNSNQESKAELMQPTDKAEIAQTELIQPSEAVIRAEQALPAQGAASYPNACQQMKQMYANDYHAKMQAENNRHQSAKQDIVNRYNREGLSFSKMQKAAEAYEARRHEQIVKHLADQYQKQLRSLSC
jgi:hypothetical protein